MKLNEISSSIWLIGEKIVSLGLNLLVMILIARSLGPGYFGDLSYILAILGFLAPITALGLNNLITKEIINRPNAQNTILGSGLIIRCIGGFLGIIILGILILTTDIAKSYQFELFFLAIANIFSAAYIFDFYIQAKMLNQLVVKLRVFIVFIFSLLRIVGVIYEQNVSFFLCIAALEIICIGVGFLVLFQKESRQLINIKIEMNECKYLFNKSSWLILSGVAAIIYLKLDQIMLGIMSTEAEVGYYAVASRLSEVWYFIPTAIVVSFFPKLIKLKNTDNYGNELQKLSDLLFWLAISVAIPVTLFGPSIINIIFGSEYYKSGVILSIHIWAGVFIFLRALLSKWLINENLFKFALVTQSTGAVLNLVLNFYLIPLYGAIGAAVATVASYAAASYLALFFHRSTFGMAVIMTKSIFTPWRFIRNQISQYKPII